MAAPSSPPQNQLTLIAPPNPRRLPPPCWSHDDTVALIDAYRDKWYALRRGNLRAIHWQEVADDVAARCPLSSPAKTSVQCRHKMEKLRKRYRSEIQRARSIPSSRRFNSSWVHFKRMDDMEKGVPLSAADSSPMGDRNPSDQDEGDDNDEDDEEEEIYQSIRHGSTNKRGIPRPINNGFGDNSGFRIKIPGHSGQFEGKSRFSSANVNSNSRPYPDFGATRVVRNGYKDKLRLGERSKGEAMGGMVEAIKALGDGFVRMERMKMEMAREVEALRMEMEMKRTEMILESQQRIVETFRGAFSDNKSKKAKREPPPES